MTHLVQANLLPEMPRHKSWAVVDIGIRDCDVEFFQWEIGAQREYDDRRTAYDACGIDARPEIMTRAQYEEFRRVENADRSSGRRDYWVGVE